jgi:hypothetical protein
MSANACLHKPVGEQQRTRQDFFLLLQLRVLRLGLFQDGDVGVSVVSSG